MPNLISLQQAHDQWQELAASIPTDDIPMMSESWNDYVDSLNKDGQLSDLQAHHAPAYDDPMPGSGSRWDALSEDREYIADAMVKLSAKRIDTRPDGDDWDASASHWRCTLRTHRGRMSLLYSMGSAHTDAPELADVLGCLLRDAEYAGETFADWCDELDMDADSRKAERMWKACKRIATSLGRLFTSSELDGLREMYADA